MIKFSIIIPIYNAEKTLNRCLNSLLNQKYCSFEVLMIDDGSKDDSKKICKSINDSRFKYYYHKNKGVSFTRNIGLKKCTGDFVCFVDSDDYVTDSYLEDYNNLINIKQCDVCIMKTKETKNMIEKSNCFEELILEKIIGGYIWNKTYRKDVLTNIFFDESVNMCEDLLFNFNLKDRIKNIAFLNKNNYIHTLNDGSLSQNILSTKKMSFIKSYNLMIKKIDNFKIKNKYYIAYYKMLCKAKSDNLMNVKEYNYLLNEEIRNNKLRRKFYLSKNSIIEKIRVFNYDFFNKLIIKIKKRRIKNERNSNNCSNI